MPGRPLVLAPPGEIAARLPLLATTRSALAGNLIVVPANTQFVRGAWNKGSIWPARVERTYRFGPPAALLTAEGQFPFHWIYMARQVVVAAFEAQFYANDVTRPGTFYLQPRADSALVASIRFDTPLTLIDLSGSSASKLGIFDALVSPEHAWCQWFGVQLDQIIDGYGGTVHGVRYTSRRHPGSDAFALSSRVMKQLGAVRTCTTSRFDETVEFAALCADPCRVMPP